MITDITVLETLLQTTTFLFIPMRQIDELKSLDQMTQSIILNCRFKTHKHSLTKQKTPISFKMTRCRLASAFSLIFQVRGQWGKAHRVLRIKSCNPRFLYWAIFTCKEGKRKIFKSSNNMPLCTSIKKKSLKMNYRPLLTSKYMEHKVQEWEALV